MNTAEFILDKVAPVFNKKGYIGTSLADITTATGLTKGAIYCNFQNKEDLALKAFELNIKIALVPLFKLIANTVGSIAKLHAVTNYQRSYYGLVRDRGGCPMLRIGVDTSYNNPLLFKAAQDLSQQMMKGLTTIIEEGIQNKEIKADIDAHSYAQTILSITEGSSLLAFTHYDQSYISNAMDFIDEMIIDKIKL
jgi:TetR/AcrR family transcriptional repressor of nem operon